MTEKNRRIAHIWVLSFKYSKGLIDPQDAYLREKLTSEELLVTSRDLLSDPDARPLLVSNYRKFENVHNFTTAPESKVVEEIRKQINLVRSQIIHGTLGEIDD